MFDAIAEMLTFYRGVASRSAPQRDPSERPHRRRVLQNGRSVRPTYRRQRRLLRSEHYGKIRGVIARPPSESRSSVTCGHEPCKFALVKSLGK